MRLGMCSGNPSRGKVVSVVEIDALRWFDTQKKNVWCWTRLPVMGGVYMFGKRVGGMDNQTGRSTQCDRCRWLFAASRPHRRFLAADLSAWVGVVIYPLIPDTIQRAKMNVDRDLGPRTAFLQTRASHSPQAGSNRPAPTLSHSTAQTTSTGPTNQPRADRPHLSDRKDRLVCVMQNPFTDSRNILFLPL
jgi:hypothetical protein